MQASESQETRIVLVDDHPLVRRALRDILEKEPDLRVPGFEHYAALLQKVVDRHCR